MSEIIISKTCIEWEVLDDYSEHKIDDVIETLKKFKEKGATDVHISGNDYVNIRFYKKVKIEDNNKQ